VSSLPQAMDESKGRSLPKFQRREYFDQISKKVKTSED
jgi:hypothetical protein